MQQLFLFHLGIGTVGAAVRDQILSIRGGIRQKYQVDLVYAGLFDSTGGIVDPNGLSLEQIAHFPAAKQKIRPVDYLKELPSPCVLIDTTASDHTAELALEFLKHRHSVIFSNKKPFCATQQVFDQLTQGKETLVHFETTVGAGLPIISTIQTLLDTGDIIEKIQGCFSGTLGFIFSQLEQGKAFSAAVAQAQQQGFTEPDPRDDLSGKDVARKALILSRLIGRKLELADISLPDLYPKQLQELPVDAFIRSLSTIDDQYQQLQATASSAGKTLRYVETITPTATSVALQEVSCTSDLGSLQGPDNLISIQTARYHDRPLVIKGPGAGVAVTAAGVVGDLISIVKKVSTSPGDEVSN